MIRFQSFQFLSRHFAESRQFRRNALVVAVACLVCVGLLVAFGDIMGEPTNRALADAVATGG